MMVLVPCHGVSVLHMTYSMSNMLDAGNRMWVSCMAVGIGCLPAILVLLHLIGVTLHFTLCKLDRLQFFG
jgi:hypothetical protein